MIIKISNLICFSESDDDSDVKTDHSFSKVIRRSREEELKKQQDEKSRSNTSNEPLPVLQTSIEQKDTTIPESNNRKSLKIDEIKVNKEESNTNVNSKSTASEPSTNSNTQPIQSNSTRSTRGSTILYTNTSNSNSNQSSNSNTSTPSTTGTATNTNNSDPISKPVSPSSQRKETTSKNNQKSNDQHHHMSYDYDRTPTLEKLDINKEIELSDIDLTPEEVNSL